MTMTEFMQNCSACGGNWGAMLLSGIKRAFPDKYEEVEAHYNWISHTEELNHLYICAIGSMKMEL